MNKTKNEIMDIKSNIHVLESNIKIWKETSIPKAKKSIEYFMNDLVKGEKEVVRLEYQVAALKKELENDKK